ncbi:hypothetical protein VQ02_06715 [Methylobacterium variabile]|uniref:Hydantoin utilization protein n=1 Tax=Methylobacterium variabile TaxID=298794 RepID=A0A0J6VP37_9HYPH|nr:hydantoinase/oxoprolinase family protein [Methylobacterium variabile]KMO40971.1 hypothetical protein VQ02_06715 [Methylobacterium variabile]
MGWRLGIDIGGTFTDVIAVAEDGVTRRSGKAPSRPAEPVRAIIDAIAAVSLTWPEVDEIVHGTTIVTNDIVEERFRPAGLVATWGFSDTIEIGRGSRRHLYRLDLPPKAEPLIPASGRFEVRERIGHDGRVIEPLTEAEIERVVDEILAAGLDTVAVCLIHAYANPEHEARLGKRLREAIPFVSLSHEISPEAREFERMSTTALNAMMMARITRHLALIAERRPEASRLHLIHSASGMAAPEMIAERPLMLAMSGPAAGVSASRLAADRLGIAHALTFDMGGTTTDVCLIVDGKAEIALNRELGGRRIRLPMVAVDSVGAGGGSIARLSSGALTVGPQSAGASPGPACYGRGGEAATVSDADLLLGYLNPGRTLGKAVTLSPAAAEAAVGRLAAAMGFAVPEAAVGIARVVHANMARALRRATIERGVDIRDFALIAFGGAGPMHAAEVARLCGIGRIVVPEFSSGFSALGCVDARMSFSRQMTVNVRSTAWDQARLDGMVAAQTAELSGALARAGHPPDRLAVSHVAGIRYSGQSYETPIADPALGDPDALGAQFDAAHRALYGYATGEPWELVNIRTEVAAPGEAAPAGAAPAPAEPAGGLVRQGERLVTYETGERHPTPVYARGSLPAGLRIAGPAIIEDEWSTIVVPPGDVLWRENRDDLFIAVRLPA